MISVRSVVVPLSCVLAFSCSIANAGMYFLDAEARGWVRSNHSTNGGEADNNYIVGNITGPNFPEALEHRNWFSFDLSSVTEEIISAEIWIDTGSMFFSQSSSATYNIASYDFLSNFETMGTGELYGQHEYVWLDEFTTQQISLNESALNAMNSTTSFGISGRISAGADFGGDNSSHYIMGHTITGSSVQLVVTTIPSPSALAPLGLSLLPVVRRRRS
jgi:hypothetical protein